MPALPVDLSDLDPFSPTASPSPTLSSSSRQPSPHPHGPLFPTPSASTLAPRAQPQTQRAAPPAAQDVRAQPVQHDADPLGLDTLASFNSLSLATAAAPAALTSRTSNGAVEAQHHRHATILDDLTREPFALPSTSSSSSSFSSTPTPHPPSHHPHPHAPFHPPRRLSTLMASSPPPASSFSSSSSPAPDPAAAAAASHFAPSSPPAFSPTLSSPFHPAHVHKGDAARRMRQASGGGGGEWPASSSSSAAGGGWEHGLSEALATPHALEGRDADLSWGDFVEAPPTPPRKSPAPPPPQQPPTTSSARAPPSKPRTTDRTAAERARTYPDPSTLAVRPSPPAASALKPAPSRAATGAGAAFDPAAQPIRLVGVRPGVERVLDEDIAEGLRPSLPPRLRLSPKWTLLYSLDQHGISLSTLFAQLDKGLGPGVRDGGFVMVVKTERGEVCGGYVSEKLRRPERGERTERWVGDGTCFLFLTRPFPPSDPRLGLAVRTFPPTFRNTYFAHASPSLDFIALGGGNDGAFGLWIDGVLERGWTGRCETFANERLVGGENGEGKFEVVGLECWAVGT
ncbi:hypothetical protein JCM10207_000208 [Rhodosporidiobolus poonsookiae]